MNFLFADLDPEIVARVEEQIFEKIKFFKDVSNKKSQVYNYYILLHGITVTTKQHD